MKQLQEFQTLQDAKNYSFIQGKMIHRNSMNAWLSNAGKYRRLKEIAEDTTHPLGDGAAAFLDSTEYNLIQSSETGQGVIALMQALVAAEGNDVALQSVLDKAITVANEEVSPYANTTEYEFAVTKGQDIPRKRVDAVKGYLDITTTADCPLHSPRVSVEVNGKYRRITSLRGVEKAGEYSCEVPRTSSVYFVDDFYGVIA